MGLRTVRPDWPLTDARGAEALICVELAAQTAGVCNGWDRIQNRGVDSDQMGWLVAVKRADFFVDVFEVAVAPAGLSSVPTRRRTDCPAVTSRA